MNKKMNKVIFGTVLVTFLFLLSSSASAYHNSLSVYLPTVGNLLIDSPLLQRSDFKEFETNPYFKEFSDSREENPDIARHHEKDTTISEARLAKEERDREAQSKRFGLFTGKTIRNIKGPISFFDENSKKQKLL